MYYRHILITIYLTCLVVILVLSNPSIKASDLANTQSLGGLSQGSLTMKRMTAMPMAFTANQGQWDDKVSFRANAGGATMWFASDGAYYQFTRTIKTDDDGSLFNR